MAIMSSLFPKTAVAQPARPSLTFFFFLVGTFLLTLVPHIIELPIWITVAVVVALIIRSVIEAYRLPLPSSTFCSLVALCLLCGVMLQFHTVLGRDPGMAFTVGLLAIKFYELRGPRDIALIIFSGYFVVMSALLFSQVIELFIYCLIMMWVLTALLRRLQIGDQPEDHLLPMLKWAGIIFLQALPLAIFLFFFFPRYPGKLQLSMGEAALGFTDTVRPGDIASLAQNNTEVMYVKFASDTVPLTGTMYWRGLVLWLYQDGAWSVGKLGQTRLGSDIQPIQERGSDLYEQEITLYPHYQKWLFALDYPIMQATAESESDHWSTIYYGDVLQLDGDDKTKVDHKVRYKVASSFALKDHFLSPEEEMEGKQLPAENFQGIKELADQLHQGITNNRDAAYRVLRYFRQEHFQYTASPGIRFRDSRWLHDFLFTTKAGFCDHYASAFAVLMRLENIPARVVVGYQGASYNPYKNIYSVTQSNAHAWDEVWIDAKVQPEPGKRRLGHWQRIDPTAVLPPGQGPSPGSNSGNQENSSDELSIQAAQHQPDFAETYLPPWMQRSVSELQLRREQMEADWDDLVFSYDPTAQSKLALALGLGTNPMFQLGLGCVVSIALCGLILQRWMRRKPPLPPVENLYAAFCQNMAQRGIPRATWEGPLAYTGRVAEAFPEKERAIRDVGTIVAHARYGPAPVELTAPDKLKSLLLLITASQSASSSREQI
jgi:transglutaminase-like putative cysteine protease